MRRSSAIMALVLSCMGLVAAACGGTVVVDHGDDPGQGGASSGATGATGATSSTGTGVGGSAQVPGAVAAACPDIAAEPLVCLAIAYNGLVVLSPTTGAVCDLLGLEEGISGTGESSVAVLGDDVHWCVNDLGLVRVSLATGGVDVSPYRCDAVTGHREMLLTKPTLADPENFGQLELYPDFEATFSGAPAEVFDIGDTNTRMTVGLEMLITAWHSTSEVTRYDLPELATSSTLQLLGFDDWVNGLWAGGAPPRLLINSTGPRLVSFDPFTGEQLGEVGLAPQTPQGGLHCWGN